MLIGANEAARAIDSGQARRVYIAEDALAGVVAPILEACRIRGVEVVYVPHKAELGETVGIDVSASIVTILKQNDEKGEG